MLRNLRRERERAVRVPPRLVRALAEARSRAVEAWKAARAEKRFAAFEPHLVALVALRCEEADAVGHEGERYDALLDAREPGMRTARLEPLLGALEAGLVPIVATLAEAKPPPRWEPGGATFPVDAQFAFTLEVLRAMGFDFARGRQDRSVHPFTIAVHRDDVRLTTRLSPDDPGGAIFSSIHEGGHGLYEQNLPAALARTAAGGPASMGLHESQSRLWENMIGRSLGFWRHFLPVLKRHIPGALDGVSVERFHAGVCRVERSLIRTEADEVTYNLHVLLRFRIELALLRGELAVADLPAAWNERMEKTLGVRPPDDRAGVLQDIHWAMGEIGYFPTYTIGNLYAAVLHRRMARDLGDVEALAAAGRLAPMREWLVKHVHQCGHVWEAEEIVRRATGEGLTVAPFLDYLRNRYAPLYGVRL
jgi:carboxypeptidase Taq